MLPAIDKALKYNQYNLMILSLITSLGFIFSAYFVFYVFFTGKYTFLVLAIIEVVFAFVALYFLFKITEK